MLKETKRFAICLSIMTFFVVTLFGCACQSDYKNLKNQVQQCQQQCDQALTDAQGVQDAAVESANSAMKVEEAADRAEQAAQRAENAAQKTESIFMKNMKK